MEITITITDLSKVEEVCEALANLIKDGDSGCAGQGFYMQVETKWTKLARIDAEK